MTDPYRDGLEKLRIDNAQLRARLEELDAEALQDAEARPWRRWGETAGDAARTRRRSLGLVSVLAFLLAWLTWLHSTPPPCPPESTCYDESFSYHRLFPRHGY